MLNRDARRGSDAVDVLRALQPTLHPPRIGPPTRFAGGYPKWMMLYASENDADTAATPRIRWCGSVVCPPRAPDRF
jgi:hypothetical protein